MKQTICVIKQKNDVSSPDSIEADCDFIVGQEHILPYNIHPFRYPKVGFISAFQPGGYPAFGRFVIRNLSAFLNNGTPEVLVELEALDPQFFCRYPTERKTIMKEQKLRELISQAPAPITK